MPGRRIKFSFTNYLYRGEQFDSDLGLYYLRARYYNPQTGRFISRDPDDGKSYDPKTLHKYLYAGGDPVNRIDPMGRDDFMEYLRTYALPIGVTVSVVLLAEEIAKAFGLLEVKPGGPPDNPHPLHHNEPTEPQSPRPSIPGPPPPPNPVNPADPVPLPEPAPEPAPEPVLAP